MDLFNINPGRKTGSRQPYTMMNGNSIFFLTHDEATDQISWNMLIDPGETKDYVEKVLRNYLTNR